MIVVCCFMIFEKVDANGGVIVGSEEVFFRLLHSEYPSLSANIIRITGFGATHVITTNTCILTSRVILEASCLYRRRHPVRTN